MSNLAIAIAVIVGVFVLGCANGYSIRDQSAKAAAAKAYKAAEAQRVAMQGQIDVLSTKYEAERERANKVLLERTNTVREYYRNAPAVDPSCGLPKPMLSLLYDQVTNANAATTGKLGVAMHKPAEPARTGD